MGYFCLRTKSFLVIILKTPFLVRSAVLFARNYALDKDCYMLSQWYKPMPLKEKKEKTIISFG